MKKTNEEILQSRLSAVESLCACYRLGKRPTEKLMTQLDKTKKALDNCVFNEFKPDYKIETVIFGKADLDELSTIIDKMDCVSQNIDDARKINELARKCHAIICEWACPKS